MKHPGIEVRKACLAKNDLSVTDAARPFPAVASAVRPFPAVALPPGMPRLPRGFRHGISPQSAHPRLDP